MNKTNGKGWKKPEIPESLPDELEFFIEDLRSAKTEDEFTTAASDAVDAAEDLIDQLTEWEADDA